MATTAEAILGASASLRREQETEPERLVPLQFDEGTLLVTDASAIEKLDENLDAKEKALKALATANTQQLINKLWVLPFERIDGIVVGKLPVRKTELPRQFPCPTKRPPTKWEKYALAKGIQKRKKDKMVFDEVAKEWRPRWGYKRAGGDPTGESDWVLEVPKDGDPFENQFDKRRAATKERAAKNELQHLRNVSRAHGIRVNHGVAPKDKTATGQLDSLSKSFHQARKSTASMGRFEKPSKEKLTKKVPEARGKKRKFDSNLVKPDSEHKRQIKILDDVTSKKPILNVEKAATREMAKQEQARRAEKAKENHEGVGKKGKKHQKAWLPPDKYKKVMARSGKTESKKSSKTKFKKGRK